MAFTGAIAAAPIASVPIAAGEFPPVLGRTKVWNGSAWVIKPVKVWNGSAWITKPLKIWNGSAWV